MLKVPELAKLQNSLSFLVPDRKDTANDLSTASPENYRRTKKQMRLLRQTPRVQLGTI